MFTTSISGASLSSHGHEQSIEVQLRQREYIFVKRAQLMRQHMLLATQMKVIDTTRSVMAKLEHEMLELLEDNARLVPSYADIGDDRKPHLHIHNTTAIMMVRMSMLGWDLPEPIGLKVNIMWNRSYTLCGTDHYRYSVRCADCPFVWLEVGILIRLCEPDPGMTVWGTGKVCGDPSARITADFSYIKKVIVVYNHFMVQGIEVHEEILHIALPHMVSLQNSVLKFTSLSDVTGPSTNIGSSSHSPAIPMGLVVEEEEKSAE